MRQTLTLHLPGPPDIEPLRQTVTGPAFSMDATWTVRGHEARLEYTYKTLRGSLPPGEVPGYAKAEDEALGTVALTGLGFGTVVVAVWGIAIGLASRRAKRRRAAFRHRFVARPGPSPLIAVRVAGRGPVAGGRASPSYLRGVRDRAS